ncbi:T6SS immunity protein Tli4 family protein [Parapedobacter defluvii]|uniref:T6SS immunity protein Tli4 family protein n=1 Tax=Parapedobacter defluvii TaxID=2045106 RepID=UPI00333FAECB
MICTMVLLSSLLLSSDPVNDFIQIEEMETHCVGRFLIDLPKGTQVKASYITAGSQVTTFSNVTAEAFEQQLAARQQELQDTEHRNGGTMFVARDDISPYHVTLISWSSKVGRRVYQYDEYQYLPEAAVLYVFSGKGNADEESRKKAAAVQRAFDGKIRYRKPLEIPEAAGLCICEGLIIDSRINREEMTVGFFLPGMPYVNLSMTSFVTREDMHTRANDRSPISRLSGVKVLRKKTREWGDLKANEVLLKYRDDGRWFYQFDLKVPSKGSSLEHPYISVSLEAGTYANTEAGKPINTVFKHDEQAIQLWDAIVSSIRLRPGAVARLNGVE